MTSLFKGIFGLGLFVLGIEFIWSALLGATFWGVLGGLVGADVSLCLGFYVFWALLGIPMIWFGAKMFFENENGFLRLLIGCAGIYLLIVGLVIGILGGIATAGALAVLSLITFIALGLAMIDYGFKLKILPYVDAVMLRLKKIVMMKF